MQKPIIELTKVSKVYPPDIVALDDVTLTVYKGEMLFLSGMSGAGKSTLLKMICGLEKPSRGIVEILGRDITSMHGRERQKLRRKIGVAYQDFRLLSNLTVFENVAMAMEITYKNASLINRRVEDLLNMLILSDKRDSPVGRLSRGEQQRVAIARAAANAPPIILADEPTGNLDPTISRQVMALFDQLNDAGSTVLIATHDQNIYNQSPHRLLELRQGRLIGSSFRQGIEKGGPASTPADADRSSPEPQPLFSETADE